MNSRGNSAKRRTAYRRNSTAILNYTASTPNSWADWLWNLVTGNAPRKSESAGSSSASHPDQIRKLLEDSAGLDPLKLAVRLSLRYGLRRGEVLGLIPETDLDLCDCTIHIQRSRTIEEGREVLTPCKTKHSNRRILILPADAVDLSTILHGYAVPLTPTQLDKRFRDFLEREALPPIRFHDLRHSYATLMLRRGVNPKIVSTVLGHSCIAITLNIYSHPDTRMQTVCLEALDEE